MLRRFIIMSLRTCFILAAATGGVFLAARAAVEIYARPRIHASAESPGARVAIVFGAGLSRDGRPSPVLRDRVATAADLFFSGKVEKLLMSGDNRFVDYNEPGAMRQYALELGVPDAAIVLDYAGRRTYDTCYRARAIFGVTDAVLVTQRFHLARAVFTCNLLGLPATGANADRRTYSRSSQLIWNLREIPASLVALWEVLVSRPEPVLGNAEPIFPDEKTAIPSYFNPSHTGEISP
jgi:SanA protein